VSGRTKIANDHYCVDMNDLAEISRCAGLKIYCDTDTLLRNIRHDDRMIRILIAV
jgi:hypothetical protein